MSNLYKTARDIDRILKSGIEILPNSPIHENLATALKKKVDSRALWIIILVVVSYLSVIMFIAKLYCETH